LNHLKFK